MSRGRKSGFIWTSSSPRGSNRPGPGWKLLHGRMARHLGRRGWRHRSRADEQMSGFVTSPTRCSTRRTLHLGYRCESWTIVRVVLRVAVRGPKLRPFTWHREYRRHRHTAIESAIDEMERRAGQHHSDRGVHCSVDEASRAACRVDVIESESERRASMHLDMRLPGNPGYGGRCRKGAVELRKPGKGGW